MSDVPRHAPGAAAAPSRTSRGALVVVLLLAAWSFAVVSPGLTGTWVYDDLRMLDNPFYDGWDDVAAVFGRNAADYMRAGLGADVAAASSETYRPVTMLGLVATHALSATPLAHHVLGWLMHLCVVLLLFRTLRTAGIAARVALLVAAVFLLHPVGVEAYVWINGRSDLSAGLFVIASAWLVERLVHPPAETPPAGAGGARAPVALTATLALLFSFGALASKETSLPALVAVWVAGAWRARQVGRLGVLGAPLLASVLGGTLYFALWSSVRVGPFGTLGPGTPGITDPDLLRFLPKLLAVGAGALLSPHAAPMQSCSWLAVRPLSPIEWGSAALFVLVMLMFARRRDVSGLVLIGGAAATLAPCALLYDAIWLGLDRYLYMPLLLIVLAVSPYVGSAVDAMAARQLRLAKGAAAVLLLLCSSASYTASGYYTDQRTWMTSGVIDEPENPTRYLMMAKELLDNGHPEAARATLAYLPPPPWPRAIVIGMLEVTRRLGDDATYEAVLDRAVAGAWDHPAINMHRIHHGLRVGNVDQALTLVPSVAETDLCPELARHLRDASPRYEGPQREAIAAAFRALPCVRATAP